jgi:hypothetical protein
MKANIFKLYKWIVVILLSLIILFSVIVDSISSISLTLLAEVDALVNITIK